MSKYVDEILEDLKNKPETFKDYNGFGVQRDNLIISGYGNTRVLSCIRVHINDKWIPSSYIDGWRLEVAIKNWYKNSPLKRLMI